MADFKFSLFGSPLLERESVRVDFGLRKSLALFAFLSVEKQVYSREELAAIFWPEVGHTTALGNLRRALYRINHACGSELIHVDRNSIELNRAIDLWIDVDVFLEQIGTCLCSEADGIPLSSINLERLVHAEGLYKAEFMAGFSLPDCPSFDEWQFFQMDSLRRSYNAVLKCLVQEYRDRDDFDTAIGYARRRLFLDVLDESGHRDLMELYGLNNLYGAAVRQYEECCRVLETELNVEPEPITTSLYQAIKQRRFSATQRSPVREIFNRSAPGAAENDSSSPLKPSSARKITDPGPPHNLPVPPFPFIGRKKEIAEIQKLLVDNPERRLISITGPGGIGKTRLAVEAASSVFRDFPHGVFLVSLSHLKSANEIFQAVASQLGVAVYHVNVSQEELFEHLQNKHMLIIFDSFEHLTSDVSFVTALLQKTQAVKILATSRERLALSSETVYSLGGMDVPDQDGREDMRDYSAVQLFIQCAKLVRPQMDFNSEDMDTVVRICRFVQGMPLAIVLSAGWLQAITLQQIADEIEHSVDFLEGTMRDLPERQRSVRAAFEYSWKRLNKSEQTAFTRLCIFSGGFSSRSAQRVAGVSLTALRTLIDKSFIFIQQDGRYQIHALLRQFGAEYLENSGEAEEIHLRHCENYLTSLGERREDLKGKNQVAALGEIETDFQNIRIAWEYALRAGRAPAVQSALESLYLYCDLRGRQSVGVELFEMAREQIKPTGSHHLELLEGRLLTHIGMLRSRYERFRPDIQDILHAGLEIAIRQDDKEGIAFGNYALGHFHLDTMQEFELALSYFQQCRELFSIAGDDYYLGRSVHMIGVSLAFHEGNYDLIRYLHESLEIARRIGDKNSEVMLLVSISMVNFYLGELNAAESYAHRAAGMALDVGQGVSLAQADTFLGIIYLTRGLLEKSEFYIQQGAATARDINFPLPLLFSKAVSSILGGLNGSLEESLAAVRECKSFPADPCSKTFILWASALVHTMAGELEIAREEINTLMEWDRKYRVPAVLRMSFPVIIYILSVENNLPLAVEVLALEEHHPMKVNGWADAWDEFIKIKEHLAALLGEKSYQASWRRGKGKSLESVMEEVLACWEPVPGAALP